MQKTVSFVLIVLCSSLLAAQVVAQDTSPATMNNDTTAIESAIQSYIAAFNAKDANAMVQLWSPEGVYVSKPSGERVEGREAIVAALGELFAEEGQRKLSVSTESIELISPNVALERGSATVERPDQVELKTDYRTIYVRRDGKWLIDRVTEEEPATNENSHQQRLKELEWLIGNWTDQAGDDTIQFECDWTKNQNYISRRFTVNVDGQADSTGLQVIGWDPKSEQIRSWLFDSNGGFVEGTWTKKDDRWFVKCVGRFPDGAAGSFTSVFRPVDPDSYGWKKVQREVDGKILPNINEVIISRQ
jgi:uncharacterized protein (TIGR02246 family)